MSDTHKTSILTKSTERLTAIIQANAADGEPAEDLARKICSGLKCFLARKQLNGRCFRTRVFG
jgi:hypothetical protein